MAAGNEPEPGLRVGPYVLRPTRGPDESAADAIDSFPGDGPAPVDADSWDIDPDVKVSNDPYRGIRRAKVPRPYLRAGILVGLVILAAAIAVPVILSTSGGPEGEDATWATAPGLGPSGEGASASDSSAPSPSMRAEIASTVGTVPFAPVAVETEAGPPDVKLRGSQVVAEAAASGGKVVQFTGESGEIQIRGISVPAAGTYRITIYYVAAASDGSARLSVAGASEAVGFPSGSGCCAASDVDVIMSAGGHTITISNSGGAPPIDRIVVSRP
jgi:Carbohydrate binding module (family 35)